MKWFKQCLIICVCILLSQNEGSSQGFDFEFTSDTKEKFAIAGPMISIKADMYQPSVKNAGLKQTGLFHISSSTNPHVLAGRNGILFSDTYKNNLFELKREIWKSANERIVTIRHMITNLSKKDLILDKMCPLYLRSADGLRILNKEGFRNKSLLVQKRFKNDFPESLNFVFAGNAALKNKDSLKLNIEKKYFSGNNDLPGETEIQNIENIKADPYFALNVTQDINGPVLLVGFLNQSLHLGSFDFSFSKKGDDVVFNGLKSECEFNSILLPTKGQKATQWIYIAYGENMSSVIDEYTSNVKIHAGIPPPLLTPPQFIVHGITTDGVTQRSY